MRSAVATSPVQDNKSIADVLLRTIEAEEMRRDLKKFVIGAWSLVEPAPFVDGWVVSALCDHLTALTLGQIRFLLINIPPRHSKSTICSVLWPVWCWLQNPAERFLCASYSLELSARDSAKKRSLIESSWFQDYYGKDFKFVVDNNQEFEVIRESDFALSRAQNSKRFSMNDKLGYQMSVAVASSTTGHGGSVLLCLEYKTKITTDAGNICIGDIVENKLPVRVLAFDHDANTARWQSIEKYESNPGRPSVCVTTSKGDAIKATIDHPFYVISKGYIQAAKLQEGDKLLVNDSALQVEDVLVRNVEPIPAPEKIYNLCITQDHNYFAQNILLHNCDDPHAANEAHSDVKREGANTWFRETWSNRMNNANKDKMLVIGQRIHEEDVSGIILRERPDWVHLNLPAEYDPERHCKTYIVPAIPTRAKARVQSFTDPSKSYDVAFLEGKAVSCACEAFVYHPQGPCKHMQNAVCPAPEKELFWEDPRKEEGELLWPERFNRETLNRYKRDLGADGYHSQYQQVPVSTKGGIFKRDSERLFTMNYDTFFLHTPKGIRAINKDQCSYFMTVDPAISEKQTADYMVIQKWAKTPYSDILLIDLIRGHWDHNDQQKEIEQIFNDDENIEFVSVEVVSYQHALFQDLIIKGIPCKPFNPHRDKVARAGVASIWQSNGKMYFLKDASWLEDFQNELYKFPKARKDDQVDATSLAAIVVRSRGPLSDDDGNYDEIPDPIEGPLEPEAIDGRQREIPFTQPFINIEENEIPVEYVKPTIKPINPFEWAEQHYGSNW